MVESAFFPLCSMEVASIGAHFTSNDKYTKNFFAQAVVAFFREKAVSFAKNDLKVVEKSLFHTPLIL